MLFVDFEFAVFLPLVFLTYWLIGGRNIWLRNLILLVSSFIFYGWWDPQLLILIVISILVDYISGLKIAKASVAFRRRAWLFFSLFTNLGLLGIFKYYNFFIDSFKGAFSIFGMELGLGYADIVLPVGISFYTFQTMSYTIDIYREKITPTKNLLAFATYVSFFPQLVAGPIEKARSLLPQFMQALPFDYQNATTGLRQILWGLIKKMVIADNCAIFVDEIFSNPERYDGSTLLLATFFFAFQIYGDFSGYTDIAIGTAKLFNIKLSRNFAYPYFSRNIVQFWRRWHISLTGWFREYVYFPLGGNRRGQARTILNICIVFLISGLWHGANWTFVIWGIIHALLFIIFILFNRGNQRLKIWWSETITSIFSIALTFIMTVLAWVVFRADSISTAKEIYYKIFSKSLFSQPVFEDMTRAGVTGLLVAIFIILEWLGRKDEFAIERLGKVTSTAVRWSIYYLILIVIFWFAGDEKQFIYFQF